MKSHYFIFFTLCSFLTSCAENYKFTNEGIPPKTFDPSQPVTVSLIEPDSGVYNTQFVISGSNFGTDLSRIKVYFGEGEKDTARLISSNGDYIYGLVPSQPNGENRVSVKIDSEYTSELPTPFKYTRMEQVSTVTGTGKTDENKDGTLAEAAFKTIRSMCMISDDNVLVNTDVPNLRLVSEKENTVTTLLTGIKLGAPCATKDRNTAYAIQYDAPHAVYTLSRENAWQPKKIVRKLDDKIKGKVGDCALSDDERSLYFCDTNGVFGKIDLTTYEVEILNDKIGNMGGQGYFFIIRDAKNDCFYITAQYAYKVFKVSTDGKTVEDYVGGSQGYKEGKREEAQFSTLGGIALDATGALYLSDTGNGRIRCLKDGYVTTVAGTGDVSSVIDGKPLEANIKWIYDLDFGLEGTLYFVECNAGMVRKFVNQ